MDKKSLILAEIYRQNKHWKDANTFFSCLKEVKCSRKLYSEILPFIDKKEIISIVGLRRVGKTVLLKQLMKKLIEKNKPMNIFFLTFDEALLGEDIGLSDYINAYLEIAGDTGNKLYIFLDEIQYASKWQHIIKRYYDTEPDCKFIISGSSSLFLKKRTMESLAGRIYEFLMPILDFEEYLELLSVEQNIIDAYRKGTIILGKPIINQFEVKQLVYKYGAEMQKYFEDYLFFGQFPEQVNEKDIEVKKKYLREAIYKKTIEYDIPKFFGVDKVDELKFLFQVLINEAGAIIEVENLAAEVGLSKETTVKYLQYFKDSFLIYFLYNFSKSFRKSKRLLKKIYLGSTNFYSAFNNFDDHFNSPLKYSVLGFIAENYFFMLLQQSFQYVSFYRVRDKEFDFIATNDLRNKEEYQYFEVKYSNQLKEKDFKFISKEAKKKGGGYTIISKETLEFGEDRTILPIWAVKIN